MMTTTKLTVVDVRPTTYLEGPGWDIELNGPLSGGVTLVPARDYERKGWPVAWGTPDHWVDGGLLDQVVGVAAMLCALVAIVGHDADEDETASCGLHELESIAAAAVESWGVL